ncbi:Maf family protein [Candidatus Pelagibacter communis]|uniref:Maf family protein n=1 Tax=Pelagibacter ubique TaxID=198252 RepID=UPI00094C2CE1|nr:Maf family protein [Candidatus Pelagibacter ubique]
MRKIILASRSEVRKQILSKNNIKFDVIPSNLDEDEIKESLVKEGADPEMISKNLAELKAAKVSQNKLGEFVLGADSVIDLNGRIISKPKDRKKAFEILKDLNGKTHYLISSVCISLDGKMIWNYTDKAEMVMKTFSEDELKRYLKKVSDKNLFSYNVYQIEGEGRKLFDEINGDTDTIMGLPIKEIKKYLESYG